MLDRFVEVMAAVGEKEREEMFGRYPKDCGKVYVAAREGVRKMSFRESSGPECVPDCGNHSVEESSKTFILDYKSYVKWVLEFGQLHMWSLRCFRLYLMRLMDLERTLKGGRETKKRE